MIHKEWRRWLFAPGPVMTTERVKEAMTIPDLCHRGSVFETLLSNLRRKLVHLYGGDNTYTTIILSGSGTAANESVLSSTLGPEDELLVLTNGEFGERLAHMAQIYGIPTHVVDFGWGHPVVLEKIPRALEEHPAVSMVAMVYHETSTSMINPIAEVAEIVKQHRRVFFVDAISAIAGENLQVAAQNIDFCTGSANKAIGGMPGLSFVCFRKAMLSLSSRSVQRNEYLNLFAHYRIAAEKNQTPHTPAIPLFVALDQALDEVLSEGLNERIARYRRCASIIREGVRSLHLTTLIADDLAASTLTTVVLPQNKSLQALLDSLDQEGYVVYPGKGPLLEANAFQIANMGDINEADCERFLAALGRTLSMPSSRSYAK